MAEKKHRTLSQVVGYIRKLVEDNLANKKFWLKVEISSIKFHRASGHCYLELVEHENGQTVAQCRGMIWSYNIVNINQELGTDFSNILKQGAEILCFVEVNFSPVFGLSVNIQNVDKYFAFGNLEKKKQETIDKLTSEKLLGKNKQHQLPNVIQHIAIIGSNNTSGHTDLVKQLKDNEFKYDFKITYFQCSVQGDKAESEILQKLYEVENSLFDVVLLIRGGGSKLDLEVFNSFKICQVVANHSMPILTGIGHETDVSAVDMVCNNAFKTPSAVGAFIVERNHNYFIKVKNLYVEIRRKYDLYIQQQNHRLKQNLTQFQATATSFTRLRRGTLHQIGNRIIQLAQGEIGSANEFLSASNQIIKVSIPNSLQTKRNQLREFCEIYQLRTNQMVRNKMSIHSHQSEMIKLVVSGIFKRQLDMLEKGVEIVKLVHPDNVLERGYSITRHNGIFINNKTEIRAGETVEIELFDRRLTATVISVNLKNSKWKTLLTNLQLKN